MAAPEAMIRMGEIYEQGFYDVKPNPKRADSYYKEGTRILSLLASQGMPSAAVALGHVYIEGLGTKQEIPRAERYFKFAEKAGYEDPEYWVWKNYGFTLRQVTVSEKVMSEWEEWRGFSEFKRWGKFNDENAKTCMYLIREKEYAYNFQTGISGSTYSTNHLTSTITCAYIVNYVMENQRDHYKSISFNNDKRGNGYGGGTYFKFKGDPE